MSASQQKVVQYLGEARASELALVRVLQSQIAMTPRGSYRSALDKHLVETRRHEQRISERLKSLDGGANPLTVVVGFLEATIGQALAFSKTPFDLLRGSGGEEKVLKNAKDTCATEALEIATYAAIERVARAAADEETAALAASIRGDEERMLERVMREVPKLADAVVGAEVKGDPSYDITKRTARQARKVPGVARAEGQVKGAVAGEGDLAIAGYDSLTAAEIIDNLKSLSQTELVKTDAYERSHKNRTGVLKAAEREVARN
jgi:ferritin-like metal-binding protein YciE